MCYRVRMNFSNGGNDFAREIWAAGFVGVWYGSWLPNDLYRAEEECRQGNGRIASSCLAKSLNDIMKYAGSHCTVSPEGAASAMRFDEKLLTGTWVFTYFDRTLHLGQIDENDPRVLEDFAHLGETCKAKRIMNTKSFAIDSLPSAFLLLPSAGRSNIHKVPSCQALLNLLINSTTPVEVTRKLNGLPFEEWIAAFGPKSWEAICLGYLIQEHGFLPTGLAVGGTLADFDIVGCLRSGELVYAQCKAGPRPYIVTPDDIEAFAAVNPARRFFFAYSGVCNEVPGVVHIDRNAIVQWFSTSQRGMDYMRLLRK